MAIDFLNIIIDNKYVFKKKKQEEWEYYSKQTIKKYLICFTVRALGERSKN